MGHLLFFSGSLNLGVRHATAVTSRRFPPPTPLAVMEGAKLTVAMVVHEIDAEAYGARQHRSHGRHHLFREVNGTTQALAEMPHPATITDSL